MIKQTITFDAATGGGNKIVGFLCPADLKEGQKAEGIVQICHGMADYFGRFEELAKFLVSNGWNVVGMDMMGHGQTYKLNEKNDMPLGYFGDSKDSAMCILKDEMTLCAKAKETFGGDLPYVLYGHSMGSFVARNIYITPKWSQEFDGFVFASTMGPNPAVGAGLFLSKLFAVFGRKRKPGKILNSIAFGAYNSRIPNRKTDFDWISSDDEVVAKYCKDELASFLFCNKGFTDLFTLVARMQAKNALDNVPSKKPVLMTYGENDPVTDYGKGAAKVATSLRARGVALTEKNYGPYRHEIQNESIRYDYFNDILMLCRKAADKNE